MVTRYIDFNRGSDSNDGSSPALAWKNLSKIGATAAAYTAGDQLLLADDSVWEYGFNTRVIPPVTWTGTKANPIVVGKYSPLSANTGKPTIKWNYQVPASAWTYDAPNNAWTITTVVDIGNTGLVRLGNTWKASRIDGTQLPLASIDGRYSNATSTFYLYAPASTNPTDYYGGVLLGAGDSGFFALAQGRGWVKYQDLHFTETAAGILVASSSTTKHGAIIERCSGKIVSGLFRAYASVDNSGLGMIVRDSDIIDWGPCAIWAYTPPGAKITELEISGCRIVDGMHTYSQGGLYIQVDCIQTGRIFNNFVDNARFGTRGKEADGSGIYMEIRANNIHIYNNTVINSHCALQDNSGATISWYNNLVLGCKTAMKVSDDAGAGTMNHTFVHNTCFVGYDVPATFGAGETSTGMRVFMETGTFPSIVVKNNIFYNVGATATSAIRTANQDPTISDYTYNAAYNYTYVARKEYLGTIETTTGSITTNPLLTPRATPRVSSPLIAAGSFLGGGIDKDGAQRLQPPTIGAYEYFPERGNAGTRGSR